MRALGRSRSMQMVAAVGATALILGWLAPEPSGVGGTPFAAALLASLAFVAAGVIAAARRPEDPMGVLMIAVGVLYPISIGGTGAEVSWRYTLALALGDAWIPVLAYVALAFPSGHLARRWDRVLFGAFVVVVFGWMPFELAWSPPAADCLSCAPGGNLFFTAQAPFDLLTANDRHEDLRSALVALILATLALRWLRASRPMRRVVGPVLLATVALGAKVLLDDLWFLDQSIDFTPDGRNYAALANALLVAAIPLAFVLGLVRARVARGGLTELVTELEHTTDAATVRDLLARALGDPNLRVGFWAQPLEGYVDGEGTPLALPDPDDRQVTTAIDSSTGPLAVLIHDPALLEDPGYVQAVGTAAKLTLENERLKAEVRAQLEQVSESRARIVEASDAERRRIERDLHDGAQQRLVSLALTLRLLRTAKPEDRDDILQRADEHASSALEELRDLARGIHPTLLTEAGLAAALHALAEQAPLPVRVAAAPTERLPQNVEAAAYFVCSEAVANAAKHAGAKEVVVDAVRRNGRLEVVIADDGHGGAGLDHGSGLRGLSDRVEALGGHLTIDSAPGAGTTLRAEIPLREP